MRKTYLFALLLCVLVSPCALGVGGDMGGADPNGSPEKPYLIEDLADFDTFADPNNAATYWAAGVHTKLMTDIDLAGRTYTTAVIAPDISINSGFQGVGFEGVFEGNNFTVINLKIDSGNTGKDYLGLFGAFGGPTAKIQDLGSVDVNITGGSGSHGDGSYYIGSLCGRNYIGTILSCYATGSITGGENAWYLGGLCGYNSYGTIINCFSSCSANNIQSIGTIGGLCGYNEEGSIESSYSNGTVFGGSGSIYVGGICGHNLEGTISNCYSMAAVSGGDRTTSIGGICGNDEYGNIINCYSGGLIMSNNKPGIWGSLIGRSRDSTITNCYFYLLSGPDTNLGTALDELQMQDPNYFSGFDFTGNSVDGDEDVWTILDGHCPKLTWQTDDGPLPPLPPVTNLLGSGKIDDPFQINSLLDFYNFRSNDRLNCGYYILNTDIYYSTKTTAATIQRFFGGHFNGNGYEIKGIKIETGPSQSYLGFFSKISGSVSNLGFEYVSITVSPQNYFIGALCGYNEGGSITNCYSRGSINAPFATDFGGLCGLNENGYISNSYSSVLVNQSSYGGGGLCGRNIDGTITNCYSNGIINRKLCGINAGTINNCFRESDVSEPTNPDDETGKTTVEMQTLTTFADAGWDFLSETVNGTEDIWRMCIDGVDYPRLWYEFKDTDLVCYDGVDLIDFSYLANYWGLPGCDTGTDCGRADIDGNGDVGLGDLVFVTDDWLK